MKLYIKYSKKYPYLPEAVAESKKELAKMLNITLNNVTTSFWHGNKTYVVIDVEED